jgi:hypothetical protein
MRPSREQLARPIDCAINDLPDQHTARPAPAGSIYYETGRGEASHGKTSYGKTSYGKTNYDKKGPDYDHEKNRHFVDSLDLGDGNRWLPGHKYYCAGTGEETGEARDPAGDSHSVAQYRPAGGPSGSIGDDHVIPRFGDAG